jgi:DNA replication licensing factor MCM3
VVGVYRCLPGKKGGFTNVSFRYVDVRKTFLFERHSICRTVLIANNIRLMSKEMEPKVSINDLKKIRSFSRQRNMVCLETNQFFLD